MSERPARILPVIVASQLAGSSPWFAGNAVLPDLQSRLGLPDHALGHITAAVQLGFIAGMELNAQKARILLMLGLTQTQDVKKLQQYFYEY